MRKKFKFNTYRQYSDKRNFKLFQHAIAKCRFILDSRFLILTLCIEKPILRPGINKNPKRNLGASIITSNENKQLQHATSRGLRSTLKGVFANVFLAIIKILSGVVGHSYALIADGIESLLDVFSSIIVWTGIKIAAAPADEHHHYGHGKAESLAALVVSLALLAAAVGLAIESLREISEPHHAPAPFTLAVLIVVVVIKETLFRSVADVGDAIGSVAVKVDAWHHRSDAITSVAAFIGISVALLFGKGYEMADDVAALVACGIIAFNGIRLLRVSIADIMDEVPSLDLERKVVTLANGIPEVLGIETCRIRKSGFGYFIDLHIEVDESLTVQDGHEIAHTVKDSLIEEIPNILDVMVHVEPFPLSEDIEIAN
ncbi:MAG: cation transporter [Calditrichaeota bacterium]|nr:MAG: cation transporter [Calditrichota bacterium]